ncbi:MAG: rhomboid family intramembrane serine protease [Chitinispirillaceae bacterium]|nr:rhomboid family intramembrane serine protease [Chitinispirillaceae bacterium]
MESPYPFTRGVKILLIANGVIYVLQLLPGIGPVINSMGSLAAGEVFSHGQIWRLVTYMFLHSTYSLAHLLLNMLALWMFGGELEERWGFKRFFTLYALFGIGSGLFCIFYLLDPLMRYTAIMGASGAVFGLLTAYAVYYPDRRILLFFIIPVKAWILVMAFALVSLLMAFSQGSGVAHLVHLGGIIVAFAYLKGMPYARQWYGNYQDLKAERGMRDRAGQEMSRKRFFEEKIDPLLEKISKEGLESLTKEEKKLLKQAGGFKEEMRARKIVVLDAFKKKQK